MQALHGSAQRVHQSLGDEKGMKPHRFAHISNKSEGSRCCAVRQPARAFLNESRNPFVDKLRQLRPPPC